MMKDYNVHNIMTGMEKDNIHNSSFDVKRVQKILLNMAVEISNVLEKNEIPYMIAYGTLLGAVRHEGFIPWDDDFDFYLFDDSYAKAIEVLRCELKNLFVEDEHSEPLYFHSWAHVKDLHSEAHCSAFPQDSLYTHKGISVDLYRTRKMPLSKLEAFLYEEKIKYIERRKKHGLISDEELKNRLAESSNQTGISNEIINDYEVFDLVPLYKCHSMKAKDVLPLRRYTFEGISFWGPNDGESILTDIYGDYLKLPPLEKRRCHYSSVKFFEMKDI